jgi:adenylate kinase
MWVIAYQKVVRFGPVGSGTRDLESETHFVSTEKMRRVSGNKGNANLEKSATQVILFLGAPGSGKGTQSSWLSGQLGIPCLSTGDMLRAESKRDTPGGLKLRKILASGSLVDDETVCEAVRSRLSRELPARGIILDGFPRTRRQAECLDKILTGMGMPGPVVLHLDVSRERLLSRMTSRRYCADCGSIYNLRSRPSSLGTHCENDGGVLLQREDDTEAVILRRFNEFDLSCAPLVEFYSNGDYHRIDGDRDTELVSTELLAIVGRTEASAAA